MGEKKNKEDDDAHLNLILRIVQRWFSKAFVSSKGCVSFISYSDFFDKWNLGFDLLGN